MAITRPVIFALTAIANRASLRHNNGFSVKNAVSFSRMARVGP